MLRKGDKNPLEINSYRPISLMSVFYKLASCCITIRIKPGVELLVGKQQKAYKTKNNIRSVLLNLLNLMKHVNENKKKALILLIDFYKAFDSIYHKYIQSVLEMYGFGDDIIQWVNAFFCDRKAKVLLRGTLTDIIYLEQ